MVIESKRKMSKEEAKELTCVLMDASRLLANPGKKLANVFGFFIKASIFIVVAILFFGYFLISGDRDVINLTGACITGISVIFLVVFAAKVNQVYKSLLKEDERHTIITLDENGIDYEEVGNRKIQTTWKNVSCVRVFEKTVCILPKDITGFIFSMEKKHLDEVKVFLNEMQINVEVIE